MTDEQIIKALECCIAHENCEEVSCEFCPYERDLNCTEAMMQNAIDLMNRQKAEIENLKVEFKAMRGAANWYRLELERKEDELHRAKVEISKHFDYMDSAANEAIKEFAERLKTNFNKNIKLYGRCTVCDATTEIDDLVKEVTEGKK